MNVRVEYEIPQIRHVSVQCPRCFRWYDAREIANRGLIYEFDIRDAWFSCPVCGEEFSAATSVGGIIIKECESSAEVYDGCLHKKEVWE